MNYDVAIRTRTTDTDYVWIGPRPNEWWLNGWGPSLLRREPTLLRQASEDGGGVLLTGIQSERRDAIQTRIRYEVSLTRNPSGLLTDDDASALIRMWWDQRQNEQTEPWPLGQRLDAELGALATAASITIDGLLRDGDPDAVANAVRAAAMSVGKSPKADGAVDLPPGPVWVGADSGEALALLAGQRAVAYFGGVSAATVGQLTSLPPAVVALVDGDDQVHDRPKPSAPKITGRSEGLDQVMEAERSRRWLLLVLVTITGLVLLYLVLKAVLGGKSA